MMNHEVGADQYIPDNMEDNTLGFGSSPGGDLESGYQQPQKATAGGGGGNGVIMTEATELNESQKLQLAERANEIYRQQLKYMQDHLASLRSLIQDKENIIENLMLRYDLGIITQDQNRTGGNLSSDEMEMEELRRKAEALAQRTILENFELREMVNELRDENFHLRNEIYELQDKINRQVLQINKLEKQAASNTNNNNNNAATQQQQQQQQQQQPQRNDAGTGMDNMYGDDDNNDDDIYGDVEEDENNDDGYSEDAPPQNNHDNQRGSHDRYTSINGNDWLNDATPTRGAGRRQSRTMDPAQTDEAIQKRQQRAEKTRKESMAAPDLFGDAQEDSEEDHPAAMSEEAQQKRAERANKTRKESVAAPDMFGDQQGDSEEDDVDDEEDDGTGDAKLGTKRRGSQVYMDAEAKKKREQRKNHRRGSSIAAPNIFDDKYDPEKHAKVLEAKNSDAATEKRMQRKAKKVAQAAVQHVVKHRRKESLAEKLLLGPIDADDDELDLKTADPEERKRIQAKARQEQRRKSRQLIKQQVGAKEHFSDDDVTEEKPQRTGLKARKKSAQRKGAEDEPEVNPPQQNNKKRRSMKADVAPLSAQEEKPKHRRDSSAPVPDLGFEDPEVLAHYQKLKVEDLQNELASKLDELDRVKSERDQALAQIELKANSAENAINKQQTLESELNAAIQSKADLASKCSVEIMRLTMILNALQQMPKIKDVVAILLDESNNDTKKNGSLLG